jgi:hypothetical protein
MHPTRLLLALLTSCAAAAPALAEQPYLLASAARGAFRAAAPPGCTLTDASSSATGGGLAFGYRFAGPFALEFGYQSYGALDLHGTCGLAATPVTVAAPDSGVQASALGYLELGRGWQGYARLGTLRWSEGGSGGNEALLGAGVAWRIGASSALRVEYQRLGGDLGALQLGLELGF